MTLPLRRTGLTALLITAAFSGGSAFSQPAGNAPTNQDRPKTQGVPVVCRVEGMVPILSVVPSGRTVKKGDVICELDATSFREQLPAARDEAQSADAAYKQARQVLNVTEIAVKQDAEIGDDNLKKARAQITLATETRDVKRKLLDDARKNKAADDAIHAAELDVLKAENALEVARRSLETLEKFTVPKQSLEAKRDFERANSDLLAKKAMAGNQDDKVKTLNRMIEACSIKAPVSGILMHVTPPPTQDGREPQPIEPGSSVRKGQLLFQIVPQAQSPRTEKTP